MLSEMTPSELGEWIADYELSPWGEEREDWRAAQLTAMYAEMHRNKAVKATPFTPQDFMLDRQAERQNKEARDAELSATIKAALLPFMSRGGKR